MSVLQTLVHKNTSWDYGCLCGGDLQNFSIGGPATSSTSACLKYLTYCGNYYWRHTYVLPWSSIDWRHYSILYSMQPIWLQRSAKVQWYLCYFLQILYMLIGPISTRSPDIVWIPSSSFSFSNLNNVEKTKYVFAQIVVLYADTEKTNNYYAHPVDIK